MFAVLVVDSQNYTFPTLPGHLPVLQKKEWVTVWTFFSGNDILFLNTINYFTYIILFLSQNSPITWGLL